MSSFCIILNQEGLNAKVFSGYQNLRNALKCTGQPVISNSGYNTSSLIQNHLKHLTEQVDSYVKDINNGFTKSDSLPRFLNCVI